MNYKWGLFILGFLFTLIGNVHIILNLNLLSIGYSFLDYICFIFTHVECVIFFIGIILLKFAL